MKGGGRVDDFNKIYQLYGVQVYKYLICLTRDAGLAEDLTQETFYQAIKSIGNFRGDCRLSVWLCQIAKYSYYRYRDKNKGQHNSLDEAEDILVDYNNPEGINEKNEEKQILRKAIKDLSTPYLEVVKLRTYGDLSFKEIGDLLGKSETWARTTFYRAKMKLKEVLIKDERGDIDEDKL